MGKNAIIWTTFAAMSRKVILIIMDGWGIPADPSVSAIDAAHTPFHNLSLRTRPHTTLEASEEAVGLPEGQMGNSEVGHTNIGAGRIVYQELVRISNALKDGSFGANSNFRQLIGYAKAKQKPIHLLGLLSDGGVHSHILHLAGILKQLSKHEDLPPVYIHVFTDGRDTDPNGGLEYVRQIEAHAEKVGIGKIASVIGRYYSMDRNNKWDRIAKAYRMLINGEGEAFGSAEEAIQASYSAGVTDEFIEPKVIVENGEPVGTINEGDAILFYNFRTDRGRQLTTMLTQKDFEEEGTRKLNLAYFTMTRYDDTFERVEVLFDKEDVAEGLGEVLSKAGKQQIRIAETEKYPHVTFFFNGGREEPFPGESRILCPSPKVATYDLQPEMSAYEIRDKIIPELQKGDVDFVCLNFANPDMVGHTGVWEAAVKACETVDICTQQVVEAALENGYTALVTADHGNADKLKNPDGSAHTAHTTSLVPLILHSNEKRTWQLTTGKLGDLAPTILDLMDIEIPAAMTGNVLIS